MAAPEIEIQRLLEEHGFVLQRQTNHQVWKNPQGLTFVCAQTPSDKWAYANALSNLRRLVNWKPQPKTPKAKKEYRKPHVPVNRTTVFSEPTRAARPSMAEQLKAIYGKKQ